MAIDVSALQTYTDAQLLIIVRFAKVQVMLGKEITMNGRKVGREDLAALDAEEDRLEKRINAADSTTDGSGGGIALVSFGEPQ